MGWGFGGGASALSPSPKIFLLPQYRGASLAIGLNGPQVGAPKGRTRRSAPTFLDAYPCLINIHGLVSVGKDTISCQPSRKSYNISL
jgi:hypothetical protein